MLSIIKTRLWQMLIVLFFLSAATFGLMKLAPGDPVLAILNADEMVVTQSDQALLRTELGFNQPVFIQYGEWLLGALQLDFGHSYMTGRPVWDELMERLPVTLQLTGGGLLVMIMISVPLGIISAQRAGKWPDHISRVLALVGASLPSFWLGLIFIYFFAFKWQLLPSVGRSTLAHFILPSVTLGFSMSAVYARLLRSGLLESFTEDFMQAGKARGVKGWRLFWFHAFRSALLPVVTVFGLSVGSLIGGSVVIEILFSWPGLGSMVIDAIFSRDYPVIQGYVLLTGVLVMLLNLFVDLLYCLIDPRTKHKKEAYK